MTFTTKFIRLTGYVSTCYTFMAISYNARKLKWNEAVNEKAVIDGCLLSDICDRSD